MAAIYEVEADSDSFVVVEADRGYGCTIICVCLSEEQANAIASTRGDWSVEYANLAPSDIQNPQCLGT